jgi:hypothetical protein
MAHYPLDVYTDRLTQTLEAWLANAHTSPERAAQVRELIEQDEHQDLSGTHPFRRQEAIYFYQRIATFIARKITHRDAQITRSALST